MLLLPTVQGRSEAVRRCRAATVAPRLRHTPESVLVARIDEARMVSPRGKQVDIPVGDGFVGMVDREVQFDESLRTRAAGAGAERRTGDLQEPASTSPTARVVRYTDGSSRGGGEAAVHSRFVVGADGALSAVARARPSRAPTRRSTSSRITRSSRAPRPRSPRQASTRRGATCGIRAICRPTSTAGCSRTARSRASARGACRRATRCAKGVAHPARARRLTDVETIQARGRADSDPPAAALGRRPRRAVLAGDAAGVVAPASGEGIFYAMTGGRLAADAVDTALTTGDVRALKTSTQEAFLQRARSGVPHAQTVR